MRRKPHGLPLPRTSIFHKYALFGSSTSFTLIPRTLPLGPMRPLVHEGARLKDLIRARQKESFLLGTPHHRSIAAFY